MGLSTYEKELLDVVMAVQKWRGYLLGQKFTIRTDQEALKFLLTQKITTLVQQKWLTKLLGFDYAIEYKKGHDNIVADPLSRLHEEGDTELLSQACAVSVVIPKWKVDLKSSWETDPAIQPILTQLAISPEEVPDYTLQDEELRRQGKLYVGSLGDLRANIIQNMHGGKEGGHSGINATIKRVTQIFWWPGINQDITSYVQSCDVCQRFKGEHVSTPGLLQPIPIPEHSWETVTMDFIESLPKSSGKDTIMVVIDKYTKYCHLIALQHPFSATQVAQKFQDQIVKLYGPPKILISDRDKIFTSHFWSELFAALGTSSHLTTAYHPQSDGQSERLNQCIEMYLRCLTHQKPNDWSKWLYMAEWWYNTAHHSAINMTPYKALYGKDPPSVNYHQAQNTKNASLDLFLR